MSDKYNNNKNSNSGYKTLRKLLKILTSNFCEILLAIFTDESLPHN